MIMLWVVLKLQCSMDTIQSKLQASGCVINLQSEAGMDGEEYPSIRPTMCIRPGVKEYNWPLPEPFWVDRNLVTLPSRSAHPKILYVQSPVSNSEAATTQKVLEVMQFPMDTYSIDVQPNPSPPRGQMWQLFVAGSRGDSSIGMNHV